ncbi:uncharacterized protein PHACADRAFT_259834 [Phanerochaete carnosa HHB-10118-sp]|uniref:Uncharacterized protein n=1 Tax=Phanerochaete carnosa (strain HHB-10118-sp) TaxID=650164 RepID=K5W2U3_PHACS|nr:uncharacterized protein PHACADRAFT_259834 [Phanerochaete carnosa HHB-10118-sp]EKM53445.1 hypothetical protein PHACADRAFT_259834 [Phanerochaete carnosa HHB-10118-sp]
MSASARRDLVEELRALAATCLNPLLEYQCLSTAPTALDDKLIVMMRGKQTACLLAFVSAVYLQVSLREGAPTSTILHTGLTCIAPALRR